MTGRSQLKRKAVQPEDSRPESDRDICTIDDRRAMDVPSSHPTEIESRGTLHTDFMSSDTSIFASISKLCCLTSASPIEPQLNHCNVADELADITEHIMKETVESFANCSCITAEAAHCFDMDPLESSEDQTQPTLDDDICRSGEFNVDEASNVQTNNTKVSWKDRRCPIMLVVLALFLIGTVGVLLGVFLSPSTHNVVQSSVNSEDTKSKNPSYRTSKRPTLPPNMKAPASSSTSPGSAGPPHTQQEPTTKATRSPTPWHKTSAPVSQSWQHPTTANPTSSPIISAPVSQPSPDPTVDSPSPWPTTSAPVTQPSLAPTTQSPSPWPTTSAPVTPPSPEPTKKRRKSPTPWPQTQVPISLPVVPTTSVKDQWLQGHNSRRTLFFAQYGKEPLDLKWSDDLALSAQNYAEKLIEIGGSDYCKIQHGYNDDHYGGENLAARWGTGTVEPLTPDVVMTTWFDNEIQKPFGQNGHATQMVFRSTHYMGCGGASKMIGSFGECFIQVCRYLSPGNCNVNADTWLSRTLDDTPLCDPKCPAEGCF